MKKYIRIILIILLLLGVGFAGYFGWKALFSSKSAVNINQEGPTFTVPAGGGLPATTEAGTSTRPVFQKISDRQAFGFWTTEDTGNAYYMLPNGTVYQAEEGNDVRVSSQELDDLKSIEASYGGNGVLASFGDAQNIQWAMFDVRDGVWRSLPSGITNATWGSNDETLLATQKNGNSLNLIKMGIGTIPYKTSVLIKNFGLKDVMMKMAGLNDLMISERPSYKYNNRIWKLNLRTLEISLIYSGTNGMMEVYSKSGEILAQFSTSGGFAILDKNLQVLTPTYFTTLPNKCALYPGISYCFAPKTIPESVKMPDDYLMGRFSGVDDLYAVNIYEGGGVEPIFRSGEGGVSDIDAVQPEFLKGYVYFINRYDDFIYRVRAWGA